MKTLEQAIKERKEHAECNYDNWEEFDDDDAIDELMSECGQDSEGHCALGGTEYCDFECPFS